MFGFSVPSGLFLISPDTESDEFTPQVMRQFVCIAGDVRAEYHLQHAAPVAQIDEI